MTAAAPAEAESNQPMSLPSAEDSDWVSALSFGIGALNRLRRYLVLGRPVWWNRGGYRSEQFGEVEPKWHVFNGRIRTTDPVHRWNFTWKSLCGYETERAEIIYGPSNFVVTPPKKAARCKRCDAALTKILQRTAQ